MPQIKPTSVQDLLKFIEDHRSDIEDGTYDILIEDDWVPHIPEDMIHFLANHSRNCRSSLSGHIKTPRDILTILARDLDVLVRRNVALNPNTPIEALIELAKDPEPDVRRLVALCNNTPSDVLATLAKDINDDVCNSVAVNPKTPNNVLAILSKDVNPETRRRVASNPYTHTDIIKILARDTYNFSKSEYESPRLYIQEAIALNPNSPPEVLEELSKSDNKNVREAVVFNSNNLKKDVSEHVREAAGGKSKKGCFIATAVYGSEFESEVELLRNYRDRVLAKYKLGRLFIATYYAISPPVAHFIKPKRLIRNSVRRFILDPMVRIIRIRYFR